MNEIAGFQGWYVGCDEDEKSCTKSLSWIDMQVLSSTDVCLKRDEKLSSNVPGLDCLLAAVYEICIQKGSSLGESVQNHR
jgi:hypothetical protein